MAAGYWCCVRIIIVGATGNVGTSLLRALRRDGPHDVVGIARRLPPREVPYDSVEWHSVDISDSGAPAELQRLFEGADSVVNLAWGFQPGRDVDYLRSVGVGGLESVLAAATAAGVPHLVHMSSVGAYGKAERGQVVDETWPTDGIPTLAYSMHKAEAERVLDSHDGTGLG